MAKRHSEQDLAEAMEFIEHMGWTHPIRTDEQKRGLALLVLECKPLAFLCWQMGKPMRMFAKWFAANVFPHLWRRRKLVVVAAWLFAVLVALLAWADVLG